MKPLRIIFKVYPQASHYISTFPLAEALRTIGHDVAYIGTRTNERFVLSRGFRFIYQESDFFSDHREADDITNSWSISSALRRFNSEEDTIGQLRFNELLLHAISSLKADLILIDSPYTIFTLPFFASRLPFAIFQILPDLNENRLCPPLDTTYAPRNNFTGRILTYLHWRRYYIKRRVRCLLGIRIDLDRRFVGRLAAHYGVRAEDLNFARYFQLGLKLVPEVILAPKALDFPHDLMPNQIYCNIATANSQDGGTEDYQFRKVFERFVLERRDAGRPLVYCSMGTAGWRYKGAECFLENIARVSSMSGWNLILAIGTRGARRTDYGENVAIFQEVPQLRVLEQADLMITHGGINSLRECAERGVRVIVCPGTKELDQAGNAARAAYHKLGEVCDLSIGPIRLRRMIQRNLAETGRRVSCASEKSSIIEAQTTIDFLLNACGMRSDRSASDAITCNEPES